MSGKVSELKDLKGLPHFNFYQIFYAISIYRFLDNCSIGKKITERPSKSYPYNF